MNNEQFLKALNDNPKSKALLERFNEVARQTNLIGEEYEKARKTTIMMIIAMDKALIHEMANEIWDDINN